MNQIIKYVNECDESFFLLTQTALTVAITGWFLSTLIIIKSIIVISDLTIQYGFSILNWGHILTFSSANINKKIFKYWITKILVPRVQMRRKAFGLANNTWCLLILDRCLAHNEEYMRKLNKHFIDYHFLVPHSSHLSQLFKLIIHTTIIFTKF
jgi:hypothetical protein